MHVRFGVIRNLVAAVAFVAFALPLAGPLTATTAGAQPIVQPVASVGVNGACAVVAVADNPNCYVSASGTGVANGFNPATNSTVLFNLLGAPDTINFTCESGVGVDTFVNPNQTPATAPLGGGTANAGVLVVPGCYDVTASVTDETTGTASTFVAARCGHNSVNITTATVNCGPVQSPLCPSGTETTPASVGSCDTLDPAAPEGSQLGVTLNPAAPHSYLIQFSGFTPLSSDCDFVNPLLDAFGNPILDANGNPVLPPSNPNGNAVTCTSLSGGTVPACPVGMGYQNPGPLGFDLTTSIGVPPFQAPLPAPDGVCSFLVSAEKKYIELTGLTLTTTCAAAPGPSTLTFAEGLKSFFGVPCTFTTTANGIVYVSTTADCTTVLTGPTHPIPQPNPFPAGSYYQCTGNLLSVVIPNITTILSNPAPVPLNIVLTGPLAAFNTLPTPTLGGLCFGTAGGGVRTTTLGAPFIVCPTGPGSGTVQVCYAGPVPDSQVTVCSNVVNLSFTLPANVRVVPYVRWAGEKQVLTKCFGGAGLMAGLPVEFTLGSDSNASATLIPTTVSNNIAPPSQNTVWTTADTDGCASVIVYAADEGVVNVDVSIFSGAGATALLNEHAFQIFYLRFEDLTLENPTFAANGTTNQFITIGAVNSLPSAPGSNPMPAGGYTVPNICQPDIVRAMVRGYFEFPGNPSGRPASTVDIPGAGALGNTNTSYTLPAGRWVLPDDWPLLATFAGFNSSGSPIDFGPGSPSTASPFAWDLNGGAALGATENAINCLTPVGSCSSTDAAGTVYNTAPAGPNCTTGLTVGIGPFDATQACTNYVSGTVPPGGTGGSTLTYTPRGATVLTGGPAFAVSPLSTNSTYLPNGTLNKWDAPMPPAQISFGITSGVGFLGQVDKAAVYQNTVVNSAGVTIANYPDPFYGEIIPASPLIPPITNNGGYLWDSFGFTSGTVANGTLSGAFVAGQETPAGESIVANPADINGIFGGDNCDETGGYTLVTGLSGSGSCFIGAGGVADTTVSSGECASLGGTFHELTPGVGATPPMGTCEFPLEPANVAPGTNLTTFGTNCPGSFPGFPGGFAGSTFLDVNSGDFGVSYPSVEVANASGYTPGQTVEVYSTVNGNVIVNDLTVAAVSFGTGANGGDVITFTADPITGGPATGASFCVAPGQGVFVSQQLGFNLSNAAVTGTLAAGQSVGFFNGSAASSASIWDTPVLNGGTYTVLVNGAEGLAVSLGNCELSRRATLGGSLQFGACEPTDFLPAGTAFAIANGSATAPIRDASAWAGGMGPYPFWNWVPNPPATNTVTTITNTSGVITGYTRNNQAATVYSDNHGEAQVALSTGFSGPTGPSLVSLGFANTAAPAACTASQIDQNTGQPNAGVICINSLGGLELGTGAVLGSSTISAVADYPYVRGINQPIGSNSITKNFTSAFLKSITVGPVTAGPAGTNTYTVTITAKDVCGNPIVGETVNVFALTTANGAVVLAPVSAGGSSNGTSAATVVTDANGTATLSLEVLGTVINGAGLTLKAVFPGELIERFAIVVPGPTPQQTLTVTYGAGYQTFSAPAPTVVTTAEKIFSYDGTAYNDVTNSAISAPGISSAPPACTGYFAYFAAPTTLTLNLPSTPQPAGTTATCNLTGLWTLLGDPFGTPAILPAGTVAYAWDGTTYSLTNQIPAGHAVWVYNPSGATTITLTAS